MKLRRQLFLPRVFYLLIILASFFHSPLIERAEAAGIKNVQRGTVTFTSGANRMPVISPAFQPVDRTKTIVWGGVVHGGGRVNSANPNASRIAFELESDTVLALERLGSPTSTPVVEWQAVEFVSGVFVQRNVQSLTTTQTTVNVPLPTTVDINKSFVLVSVAPNMTGQANDERWTIRAQLTGSNNLELFRADSGIAVDVYWQVVEMQGASVQRGLTTFPSTANATSATIPTSVDPLKSFLIMSFAGGSGINGIETRYMVRGAINTTGNAITFNRAGSGNAVNLAWEIVAMNDGSAVQSGSRSTAAGSDTLLDQGIADVDLSRSFVYLSVQGGASGATNSLDDVSWTGALTSQTNLRLQRAVGGSQGTVNWQVVQFALPATQLAITTQPANAAAGSTIPGPLTVAVQDSSGNVVISSTASITVAIGANPGGGTLSGTLTRNAVSGVATFSDLSLDKVGNGYTLTVSSVGLTGTTSAPFNIGPGAATKLAFTMQPGNANAGSNIPGPPTVTVQDSFNNTVTSSTAAVTMALGNNPGGGALSGTTTKNASGGVASFSDLSINQPGSGYTLAVSSISLTGATSNGFNIIAVVPDLVVSNLNDPPTSAVLGGSFSVADTTANNGNGASGASTTSYRLSTDAVVTGSDPLLTGSRSVPSLAAGSNSPGNVSVTIPTSITPGTYFLGACADHTNTIAESNETNNCTASAASVVIAAAPSISSLSPTAGSIGTSVTIAGANFGAIQGTSIVAFNGTTAAPASWSANSIVVPVPAAATTGPVMVTVDGVASNGVAFTVKPPIGYIYDALGRLRAVIDPSSDTAVYNYDAVGNLLSIGRQSSSTVAVIEFSPKSGPAGTTVTIQGTGFGATVGENTVTFNGASATVTSATATQIVASVPTGATTGPIGVTTLTGSGTSSTNFLVTSGGSQGAPTITSFTPTIGTAGTAVTINGTNFQTTIANNNVIFNTSRATISSTTATTIATSVPAATSSGRISVSTPFGKTTSIADFFIPPSPYTPADVEFTGRMLIGGNGLIVTLSTAKKIALVLFDGTAGQRVGLGMTNVVFPTCGGAVLILKPDGTTLASNTCVSSSGADLDVQLPVTGTHTILVDPNGTSTGSMTLTLSEPITGTITVDGPSATVNITQIGQTARINFSGTAGQKVSLAVTSDTFAGNVGLTIFNPDGSSLTSWCCGDTGTNLNMTLSQSGIHTILMDPGGTDIGSMTFLLSEEIDAGSITINGASTTVTTTRAGQRARLTFSGTAGQKITLAATSDTFAGNVGLTIFNPDGSSLTSWCCGDTGTNLNMTLPQSGIHTILMDPGGNDTGSMMFLLSEEIDAGSITINGTSVHITIGRIGQRARLTFSVTASQQATVRLTGNSMGLVTVSLLRPDSTQLTASTSSASSFNLTTQTLATPGIYTILVDPSGLNTGSMDVSVTSP